MQLAVMFSGAGLMSMLPRLGMLAGGMLLSGMAKKNQPTNRLNDLKVSGSSYGRGLPICFGTMRCTGNMIWATDMEEVKTYVGAKGKELGSGKGSKKAKKGKAQVVYLYYANFAMALCEGTKSKVLRIWCDSNCIYDTTATLVYFPNENKWLPGYVDDQGNPHPIVVQGFSQGITGPGKSGGMQKKGNTPGAGSNFPFIFYGGSEAQLPDPFMVSKSGASAVPAYRGTCYLMFEHFPVADFGNRIPTVTAEVVDLATSETQILPWTPLVYPSQTPVPTIDAVSKAWIDPSRKLLIQAMPHIIGGQTYHAVREWDTTTGMELKRLDFPIPPNGSGVIGSNRAGGISVAGNDFTFGTSVGYYNPSTGNKMGQSEYPVEWPPVVTFPLVQASSDQSNPTKYATCIKALFGYISVDQDLNTPTPNPIHPSQNVLQQTARSFGNSSTVFPGAPGTAQSILVLEVNDLGDYSGVIYAVDPALVVSKFATLPHLDTYMTMEPPIWMQGADCYLVMRTAIPTGVWFVTLLDKDGNIIFDQQISFPITGTGQLTHMAGGPNIYLPIPVCTGTKWLGIFAAANQNLLVQVDCQLKAIAISGMNTNVDAGKASFPFCLNPQFYLEDSSSIVFWGEMTVSGVTTRGWWQAFVDRYTNPGIDIAQICQDLCLRVGIPIERINTGGMAAMPISGYLLDNPAPARKVIEDLAQVYFFDVAEVDGVLKFVSRGQDPVVTITQKDLGTISGDAHEADQATTDPNDWYVETRIQEIDIPQTVHVSFIDPGMDYQNGTQGFRRPISPKPTMQSREIAEINLAVAMTNQRAIQIAETVCLASWAERINHKFLLGPKYLRYDPSDVVLVFMDSGLTFIDRILSMDVGGNLQSSLTTVSQLQPYFGDTAATETHHSPYDPQGIGARGTGVIGLPVPVHPLVQPLMMDIPLLEDKDAGIITGGFPLYWGAGAWGPGYAAGEFQEMVANSGNWVAAGASGADPPWGSVAVAVPAPPNGPFVTDRTTVITLSPEYDYEAAFVYEWQSIGDSDWPAEGVNTVLIGSEIIIFKDVVVNDDKTVTISTLIRGHRGTENACFNHQPFEQFVILDSDGNAIRMASVPSTALNGKLSGEISGAALIQRFAPTQTITFKGNALRPYAPSDIERADDGSHNAVITWQRRTRYNGVMQDGNGIVPLNEDSESYRLFLCATAVDPNTFDPTDATSFKRTVNLTSPTYTYLAADRTIDGLANDDPFWVVAYQISGEVGLGFPGVAKLETNTPSYR